MTLKKRFGVIAAALALTLGGVAAVTVPAQAAATDCPNNRMCLWEHANYGSPMYVYSPTTSCYPLGVAINNKASSVRTRSVGGAMRFYDSANCTGDYFTIPSSYSKWSLDLGFSGRSWNDKISSFRIG